MSRFYLGQETHSTLSPRSEDLLRQLDQENILSQLIYEKSIKEKALYEKEIRRLEAERQKNLRRSQELKNKYRESIRTTKDSKENENSSSRCRSNRDRVPFGEISSNVLRYQEKAVSPIKIISRASVKNQLSVCVSTQTEQKTDKKEVKNRQIGEPNLMDTAELISKGSMITALKGSNMMAPLILRSSSSKPSTSRTSKRSERVTFSPEASARSNSNFHMIAETSRKNPLDSLPQETDRNPLMIQELQSVDFDDKLYQVVGELESLEYSVFSETEDY